MLQFIVASHGNFASEALKSGAMIYGEVPANVYVLSIQDEGPGAVQFAKETEALAEQLAGNPVLILSDFFGGSPFMILLSKFRNNNYKLISGFNLPMVVEMLQCNGMGLEEAANSILTVGRDEGIRLVDKKTLEEV